MSSTRSVGGRRTPRTQRLTVLALEGRTLLTAMPQVDTFAVPTLSASPGAIIDGPDGDLWFTETTGKIGRVTPQGQVTEFSLPTPKGGMTPSFNGLAAGPDGAVWGADINNARVDRIGPDGQVESFPIPGAPGVGGGSTTTSGGNNGPMGLGGSIVAGPDGNLWFTFGFQPPVTIPPGSTGSNPSSPTTTLERITPQGVVTAFPLPLGGGSATSLAASPSGVWFLDPSAGRVGKVDITGHVDEFPAPTPSPNLSGVSALAMGPDGDAYYFPSAGNGDFVVKVTPDGKTTNILLPAANPPYVNLFSGPGGVYFLTNSSQTNSSQTNSDLDRLGPDGVVTSTPISIPTSIASSNNNSQTFGPDGNLWFTENYTSLIDRLDVSPTPAPPVGQTLVSAASPPVTSSYGPVSPSPLGLTAPAGESTTLTLADFRHSAGVSIVSATIDWGDGSKPTGGTLGALPNSDNTFENDPFVDGQVLGSHVYAKVGSETVTVTIQGIGPGGLAMSTKVTEAVSAVDPSPSPLSPPLTSQASRSIAFQGPVALFSTPTTHDSSGSDFTATIDWGDGSATTIGSIVGGFVYSNPTSGSTSSNPSFGTTPTPGPVNDFEVSGGHTYASSGSFTVKVTLADQFDHSSTESTPIQVVPGPLELASITPATDSVGPNGVGSSINLATLTDFQGTVAGRTYSATVDWGDGTTSTDGVFLPSSIPPPGGYAGPASGTTYEVQDGHAYAKPGTYPIQVTVLDNQGDSAKTSTTYQSPAPALQLNGSSLNASAGDLLSGVDLATITPPVATDPASDFTATIDWGDGSTPTAGMVVPNPAAPNPYIPNPYGPDGTPAVGFAVAGNHTYATPGLYDLTVSVDGPGGLTASTTASESVTLSTAQSTAQSDPVDSAPPIAFTQGVASPPTLLSSIFVQSGNVPSDFKATVDWGDGSPVESATLHPGTSASGYGSILSLFAGHDYAKVGTYAVTTAAVGADGIPALIFNTAIVSAPAPVSPPPVAVAPAPPPGAIPPAHPVPVPTRPPVAAPTPQPISVPVPTPSRTSPLSPTAPPAPMVLPSPFPRFAPTVEPRLTAEGPKPSRHAPTSRHVAAKSKPVAEPKGHPARGARPHR